MSVPGSAGHRPASLPFAPPPVLAPGRGGPLAFALRWSRRLALALAGLAATLLLAILVLRFVNPPMTPVMAAEHILGEGADHRWVPLERISPHLVRAVLLSEDARFCTHHGVDMVELRAAIRAAQRGNPRGASTITMQVIKNLFLWPQRSYVRKIIELPLALVLDLVWPKRRVLEVYLNIAEWGPGVYGIEAAAQRSFGKSAAMLTMEEAVRLAVALPNPAERDPAGPDEIVDRLSHRLAARMGEALPMRCLR